jgi:hypothetical protein
MKSLFTHIRRLVLRRLERPRKGYEHPIIPAVIPKSENAAYDDHNPFGGGFLMRHYYQIVTRDFDLSSNFEIIKFNIIGTSKFEYQSLWVEKI